MRFSKQIVAGAAGLLALSGVAAVALIDTPIERDCLHGVTSGMRRDQVPKQLAEHGVISVIPEVSKVLVVRRGNVEALAKLTSAPGICVSDSKGIAATAGFDSDGELTSVYESAKKIPRIATAQTRTDLLTVLRAALSDTPGLVVSNCIPNARTVPIAQLRSEDYEYLSAFEAWHFHEPDSYSTGKISFADDIVVRIEYRWRPVELP